MAAHSETVESILLAARRLDSFVAVQGQRATNRKRDLGNIKQNFSDGRSIDEMKTSLIEDARGVLDVVKALDYLENSRKNAEPILDKLSAQAKKDQEGLAASMAGAGASIEQLKSIYRELGRSLDPVVQRCEFPVNDLSNIMQRMRADPAARALANSCLHQVQAIEKLMNRLATKLSDHAGELKRHASGGPMAGYIHTIQSF